MRRCFLLLLLLVPLTVQPHCLPPELTGGGGVPMPTAVRTELHVNQFGYLPSLEKVAVLADPQTGFNASASYTPPAVLHVRQAATGESVFSAAPIIWDSGNTDVMSGDKAWWFDFSAVSTPGTYYISDPGMTYRSDIFEISDNVYREVLKQSVRMYFYQRSGFAKQAPYADTRWVDGASHLGTNQDPTARPATDPTNGALAKDLRGGWYDAGDYNKYSVWVTWAVSDLLLAYEQRPSLWTDDFNIPESGNGIPDLLDEVKWALDFLLRMQAATGNGSVLSKASALNGGLHEYPPSADPNPRYYGYASTASSAYTAGAFAHAARLLTPFPSQASYVTTLTNAAVAAWTWAKNNTTVDYNNEGFANANPEAGDATAKAYMRTVSRIQAAVHLYALTGQAEYKTYVESNYTQVKALGSDWWSPFHPDTHVQNALLLYTIQPGITGAVKTDIENSKIAGIGMGEWMYQLTNKLDPYRAFLQPGWYVWGSNMIKSQMGNSWLDMVRYGLNLGQATTYRQAALGYVHYVLGVNPWSIVYLSNMYAAGAKRSADEIWHSWYFDGSPWDNAITSPKGPAPGYLAGGPNEEYAGLVSSSPDCQLTPPLGQPRAKSYINSNINFVPPSSDCATYAINEPGIYYQAAWIRLLSYFVP